MYNIEVNDKATLLFDIQHSMFDISAALTLRHEHSTRDGIRSYRYRTCLL